jgi:hypothetical protein
MPHRDIFGVQMGQERRSGRTRAEVKPTEIVLYGEMAQPNEQNLKERLINDCIIWGCRSSVNRLCMLAPNFGSGHMRR